MISWQGQQRQQACCGLHGLIQRRFKPQSSWIHNRTYTIFCLNALSINKSIYIFSITDLFSSSTGHLFYWDRNDVNLGASVPERGGCCCTQEASVPVEKSINPFHPTQFSSSTTRSPREAAAVDSVITRLF